MWLHEQVSIKVAPEIGQSSAGTTFLQIGVMPQNRCRTNWKKNIAFNSLRLVMRFVKGKRFIQSEEKPEYVCHAI